LAQRRRGQAHQPVEYDLEHRQTLVRDHTRIDDGANAGIVGERDVVDIEAQERVDLVLVEDALRAAFGDLRITAAFVDHRGPLRRHVVAAATGSATAAAAPTTAAAVALVFERHAPFGG
jgi:hypothetical protein